MNRRVVICALIGALLGVNTVWGDDYNPPDWRDDPFTTYQHWVFDSDTNPTTPDFDYDNEFGAPSLSVMGDWPKTDYLDEYLGRDGVWRFEEYIVVTIGNYEYENPFKEIWIQLTYTEDEPFITTEPGYASINLIDRSAADDNYWYDTWQVIIEPNPASETIAIVPTPCTLYVDQIVIDTRCVPEPTTICLLGLGALALLRKRRS